MIKKKNKTPKENNIDPFGFDFKWVTDDDLRFCKRIYPYSGIEFHQNYMKMGDKYATVMLAVRYSSYIDHFLFAQISRTPNTLVSIDFVPMTRNDTETALRNSLEEIASRSGIDERESDRRDNTAELEDTRSLYDAVKRGNEAIVTSTLRIYVSAATLEELQRSVEIIKDTFRPYGVEFYIPQNEMQAEYRALQRSSDTVEQAIPIYETLQEQYPFYHQSFTDKNGLYFGYTSSGGRVTINFFTKDENRQSYDALLIGKKGSGKSATLKDIIQSYLAIGHKIFVVDVENEFCDLARVLGGKIIRFSSSSRLNPLEMSKQVVQGIGDEGAGTDYAIEINRVESFLREYAHDITDMEAEILVDMLNTTYAKKNITPTTDILSLSPKDFPIFSDLLQVIRENLYIRYVNEDDKETIPTLTETRRNTLEKLEIYVKAFAEGVYSDMFNGHSTVDIGNEPFIVFDISNVSQMKRQVYNAQMLNITSIIWNHVCANRELNKGCKDDWDRNYILAIFDEAHQFLNTNNPHILSTIEKLVRRSRKYDCGLFFASQSPRDFVPSADSEMLDRIKNIFSLVQYRMIMQQDDSNMDILRNLFPQFTDSELRSTATYQVGEMILATGAGKNKIHCYKDIDPEDFKYFKSGREF